MERLYGIQSLAIASVGGVVAAVFPTKDLLVPAIVNSVIWGRLNYTREMEDLWKIF